MENIDLTAKDHLDLIRAHVQSLFDCILNSKEPLGRPVEVRGMLWGILDRVVAIENEVMGTEFYDGQHREAGP